jgi:hypothetical protein
MGRNDRWAVVLASGAGRIGYDVPVIQFHAGQREVQDEANSRPVADLLASRSKGPDAALPEPMRAADLVLLAMADEAGDLRFQAVSGAPPLLRGDTSGAIEFPDGIVLAADDGTPAGGIAVDLATRRRSRLNGTLTRTDGRLIFHAAETFANCRKYVAPSVALRPALHVGPCSRDFVALDDAGLKQALATAETAFIASLSPAGLPDVSHRGGPDGFLTLDAAAGTLCWPELIGNGMFKTAGNIRATGVATLLVLDVSSGDAYEFCGHASYRVVLRYDEPRERGLWPSDEDFPTQGKIVLQVSQAYRLERVINPRRRLLDEAKVTSCSPVEDQVPR